MSKQEPETSSPDEVESDVRAASQPEPAHEAQDTQPPTYTEEPPTYTEEPPTFAEEPPTYTEEEGVPEQERMSTAWDEEPSTEVASYTTHARVRREPYPSTDRSRLDSAYSFTGLACLLGGLGLVAVASLSPGLTQSVETFGNPKVLGAVLALGGALLFGLGRVRRVLGEITYTVAAVREKTDLLDEVAGDGELLRQEVGAFSAETDALRSDVAAMQQRLCELIEVADNPEIQVSIFQLAASQDKLAMRLDKAVSERIRALQGESKTLFESIQAASKEQGKRLDHMQEQLTGHAKDLPVVMDTLVEELGGVTKSHDRAAAETAKGLDQVRGQVESRLESSVRTLEDSLEQVRSGLEQRLGQVEGEHGRSLQDLAETLRAGAAEAATGLELMREQVEGRLDSTARTLEDCLEQVRSGLEQRLGQLEGEHGRSLQDLAETLRTGADEDAGSLRESLEGLAASLRQTQAELQEGHSELRSTLGHELEALGARQVESWVEVRSEFEELSASLEQQLRGLEGASAGRHDELTQAFEEDRAHRDVALAEAVSSLGELTRSAGQKLVDDTTEMALRIEQLFEDQSQTLGSSLRTSALASEETAARLERGLHELGEQLTHGATRTDDYPSAGQEQLFCEIAADRGQQEGNLGESGPVVQAGADDLAPDGVGAHDAPLQLDATTPQPVDQGMVPPAALPRRWGSEDVGETAGGSTEFGAWVERHTDPVRFDLPDLSGSPSTESSSNDESDAH